MGTYIVQADIEARLSPATVLALFDDDNDGVADAAAIAAIIDDAEAMVDSWLRTEYAMPLATPTDRLVKRAALMYAVAYSFDRHPEYERRYGEKDRAEMIKDADAMMRRIVSAKQQLPDQPAGTKPANVGAIVYDAGPRTMIDSADGASNNGEF